MFSWLSEFKKTLNPQIGPRNYGVLVDAGTFAVLFVSEHVSAVVFLSESVPGTMFFPYVYSPPDLVFASIINSGKYPNWRWKSGFLKTRPDLITPEILEKSEMARDKHDFITRIMFSLSMARAKIRTGVDFQETVYASKKYQAQRFKDLNYNESLIVEFPYVVQYADYAGVSLKQAADDILFRSKLDDDLLAKTELLRIKYFNKVKNAKSKNDLGNIYGEFLRESYINAMV